LKRNYVVKLFEVILNNLYSQLSKSWKKNISVSDLSKLKVLDPASKLKKDEVASAYLHWIIKDYFNRYFKESI